VLRSPLVIAASTIVFGLLLWISAKKAKEQRAMISFFDAVIIGLFQAIALIPGASRSGITITAGLLLGLHRESAARFSFLLSIPVIALAGMVKGLELYKTDAPMMWDLALLGALVSAIMAYISIGWFLRLLNKVGMIPFVIYRLILGVVLFALFI
jgi:undecaprenyl-diphosphatase